MDARLASQMAKKVGISAVQIIREEYEMVILREIFESELGEKVVFKGGTAIRLAYGSPRFSDDLDFGQIKRVNLRDFAKLCDNIVRGNKNLALIEVLRKYFTLFAFFKIKDPALSEAVSIKVEISTREKKWAKDIDFRLINLKSEVTPLVALAQVATLERILREKQKIEPKRIRDIFDIWYINGLLGKKGRIIFSGFKKVEVKRELFRLLPQGSRRLIDLWLEKN